MRVQIENMMNRSRNRSPALMSQKSACFIGYNSSAQMCANCKPSHLFEMKCKIDRDETGRDV